MKNKRTAADQIRNLDKIHWHIQHWKSDLQFMGEEIKFVEKLMNSNIFDPNTLNLFERLQDYLGELDRFKERKTKLTQSISQHESRLGSVMETQELMLLGVYYQKHDDLEIAVYKCMDDFKTLKTEIFDYVGGTLKKEDNIE